MGIPNSGNPLHGRSGKQNLDYLIGTAPCQVRYVDNVSVKIKTRKWKPLQNK